MPHSVAASIAVAVVALLLLAVTPLVMMGFMMGGDHGWMMGGRGSDPAAERPVTGVTGVRIEDFAFSPANLVVDAGATVTWTNNDSVGHTVTSDDGDVLDSALLDDGETFSSTFDTPGEYAYHCTPHPNMQGLVTVLPAETS